MTVQIGDVVRTSMNFSLGDGSLYQNVYHHLLTGIFPVGDAAVITAITTKMQNAYGDLVSLVKSDVTESLSYVDIVAWNVDKWEVTYNVGTFTITFSPVPTTDALPNMDSPFVVFKTLRPKTVGRKFLFPVVETMQANGILVAGAVTNIVAYATKILGDISLGGSEVLEPGVVRTSANYFYEFGVAVVTDLIGTQRRRRRGVGA